MQLHIQTADLPQWKNPRFTTISYASIITFIFFTRYVPVLKYVFKGLYIVLGSKFLHSCLDPTPSPSNTVQSLPPPRLLASWSWTGALPRTCVPASTTPFLVTTLRVSWKTSSS